MSLWETITGWWSSRSSTQQDRARSMEGQLGQETASPPPYSETATKPDDKACQPTEQQQHQPAKNGEVGMTFLYDRTDGGVPVVADLDLRVKDVAAVMKKGLHCSDENIEKEHGYITTLKRHLPWSTAYTARVDDWTHCRYYLVRDRSEEPLWSGAVWVYGRGITELASFRLNNLSVDNVVAAKAWNARDETVYHFHRRIHEANWYNAIFDDMPMQGLWPWPRPQDQEESLIEV